MAVAGQVVDTLAGLLAGLAVGAQFGQDRIEPPGVQLVPPVLAPPDGQVRAGAVDGLGDITQMPLGVVDVDDFDGAGELFGGQIPDPLGPVADDDASRRGVEAAPPRFAIRPLRERGRQRVGGAAGRALDRSAVADRPGVAFGEAVGVACFRRPHGDELDLAGLGRAVGLLAAPAFHLGLAHRHAGAVKPQVHRPCRAGCGLDPLATSAATSRPSASAMRSTCLGSTATPASSPIHSLASAKLTLVAASPTSRAVAGDSEVSCRPTDSFLGGRRRSGSRRGHDQRPQQRGEGLRAAAGVVRRLAAGARYRRTRMVGIVVVVLRHRLSGEAEGLAAEGLLEGLEVLRGGPPRSDERIDFGRERGYERCAPITLTAWLAGEGSTVNGLQEGLEVLGIRVSSSEERVHVGLDRRVQRGEQLLDAPFFGRVIERFSQLRLGHGRSPPTRVIGRSGLAQYPQRQNPQLSCRAPDVTVILDIIHVVEYVWKAGRVFHREGSPELTHWAWTRVRSILEGKATRVAASMRRAATVAGFSKDTRKPVDKCADYLVKYAPYLHYDRYLAAGYPIATGVIEGACRHLVRDRMELTGARWRLVGAEAVLKLRALRASGDFDAYWDFHEAREYERNHAQRYTDGTVPPVTEPPPPPSSPRLRRVK